MELSNLKVAIASAGISHVTRGIEVWAKSTASALHDRGCDVTLCRGTGIPEAEYETVVGCLRRDSEFTDSIVRTLPKRLSWRFGFGSAYSLEQTSFALRLLPYLRRNDVDVLHVQDPPVARIVQWAHRRGLLKTRVILGHGTDECLEFIRHFDYLQHLSPWHLESAKTSGCWKKSWTAIPNFVDTRRFSPRVHTSIRSELQIPEDAVVVLTAAAITREVKRVDRLIESMSDCLSQGERNLWAIIAGGRAKDTDELITRGIKLLGDRVRFLVNVPPSKMPSLYNCADIFVLGSDREMMPIALLEATASGLPCLVNRHPVMQWMIGPGGESLDLSQPGTLADAIVRLANNPMRRSELGRLAREHCVAEFGRDRVVDQILDYYQQVCGTKRQSGALAK